MIRHKTLHTVNSWKLLRRKFDWFFTKKWYCEKNSNSVSLSKTLSSYWDWLLRRIQFSRLRKAQRFISWRSVKSDSFDYNLWKYCWWVKLKCITQWFSSSLSINCNILRLKVWKLRLDTKWDSANGFSRDCWN